MLPRALVAAAPGPRRRTILSAVDEVDALVRTTDSIAGIHKDLGRRPFDLLILDHASVVGLETHFVSELLRSDDAPDVIVLLGAEDTGQQVAYMGAGCAAALVNDIEAKELIGVLARVAQRRRDRLAVPDRSVPDTDYELADYATVSPVMRDFLKSAKRVADRDSTLLILGETGVGKGLLARSMHNEGPRAGKPFVSVNCGGLTDSLLESELFGHERGAFTGADRTHRGHFELAHTGTIFLDEIGEMPLHLQVKLLQVLEERRIQPVGSERSIPIDVRIMAATNKNLAAEVAAKRFREDLFYRLNVISLTLPPLRERREDIPELGQSYVDHFSLRMGNEVRGISPDALAAISRYGWPGNLREFINAIERAMIFTREEEIQVEDLPVVIQEFAPLMMQPIPASEVSSPESGWADKTWGQVRRQVLEEAELRYLAGVLRSTAGHISEASRRAGMDPRSVREKMRRYGLKKEDFK